MADEPQLPPSFTRGRKWRFGLTLVVNLAALLAIVLMVNYISQNFFFRRVFVSPNTRVELSGQTLGLLKSITNEVKVTLYYDKDDGLYSTVAALVNEYRLAQPRISVETVDYAKNPGEAQRVKLKYKLDAPTDKNLIIFDCGGRSKVVNGDALMESVPERVPNERELEYRKRPVAFKGEMMCSALLLAVTSPKPLRACYLTGHGEHTLGGKDDKLGYSKFAGVVLQNYISLEPLSLLGTNTVPADCAVLILAGPKNELSEMEVAKIGRYLDDGGRLFALFNVASADRSLGVEPLLAKWGVKLTRQIVSDEQNSQSGKDIAVKTFSKHPVVNALPESSLYLILPRVVSRAETSTAADAPKVDEIALTGPKSRLVDQPSVPPQPYPVAVAVEKGAVPGVAKGITRLVVVGDSMGLDNEIIDYGSNRDFASYALNWLVDRPQLLEGVGPRPVTEFRMLMTHQQWLTTIAILLGGLPGAALFVGLLVWLRRRS
jgi:hypothetical protein